MRDQRGIPRDTSLAFCVMVDAGVLRLSLVAELDGRVLGHVAFSPVTMSDGSYDGCGLGSAYLLPALRQGSAKAVPVEIQGIPGSIIWRARLFKRGNCL